MRGERRDQPRGRHRREQRWLLLQVRRLLLISMRRDVTWEHAEFSASAEVNVHSRCRDAWRPHLPGHRSYFASYNALRMIRLAPVMRRCASGSDRK